MKCQAAILISLKDFFAKKPNDTRSPTQSKKIYIECTRKSKTGQDFCGIHLNAKKIVRWNTLLPCDPTAFSPESSRDDDAVSIISSIIEPVAVASVEAETGHVEVGTVASVEADTGHAEAEPEPVVSIEADTGHVEVEPEPVSITRYGYCVPLETPLLRWNWDEEEKKRWVVEKDTFIVYRIDDEGYGCRKGVLSKSPRGPIIGTDNEHYDVLLD